MFSHILGQDPAVQTLTRALDSRHVHHAYRFEGPAGVGKERAAFALAQALVCERGGPRACEKCSACQRAVRISAEDPQVPAHPDVILLQRGLYRGQLSANEATGISIEQVRRMVLERVGFGPHEGRARMFIIRDADELTVSAANALLKTLEEPGQGTHFVLLTSRPNRLLDTIRSRTLPVRFSPLSDALVAQLLQEKGLDPKAATLAAIGARDLAPAIKFAEARRERDSLRRLLAYFAQSLALSGREEAVTRVDRAERFAEQHRIVLSAMQDVDRNVSPALALESMIYRLRQI
jgi:DNA polymerase III subunit delta'